MMTKLSVKPEVLKCKEYTLLQLQTHSVIAGGGGGL